jgi:hypothetical protein
VAGFGDLAALDAPEAGDDLVAEAVFDGVFGVEVVEESRAEGVELFGVLGGDEKVAAGETVLEGVAAGAGLALAGAGSGGLLGVAAIGFDLTFGAHDSPPRR